MRKIAFFDLDETIYQGYTTNAFIRFLAERSISKFGKFAEELNSLEKQFRSGTSNYINNSNSIMNLLSRTVADSDASEIMEYAREFVQETLDYEEIYPWVLETIGMLKERDFEIVLISGGADFLVKEFGGELGLDHYFATELPIEENTFIEEKIKVLHSDEKVEKLRKCLTDGQEEGVFTMAFGDSTGDIGILEAVDSGFLVPNANDEMKEYARTHRIIVMNSADSVWVELSRAGKNNEIEFPENKG